MGLKCSLLGHSFDEEDVERQREERGSEVVTIIREVERCSRCGRARTVSENKEVTSIIEPEETGAASGTGDAGAPASESDGVQLDDTADPEEDDAEILRDDRTTERSPGQWPDDDEPWEPDDGGEADEATGTDETDGTDEAATDEDGAETDDATPTGTDHAEVLDDGPSDAGAESGGAGDDAGLGASDGGDPTGGVDPSTGSEIIDASDDEPVAAGSGDGTTTAPGDGFTCPECGFTTAAANTSLREGDACPECQRGYLESERNQ